VLAAAVAWGSAFLVLGLRSSVATAVVLLGVAYMVFDVAGRTLLQRAAPADIVSRVFGLTEAVGAIGLAAGSGFVPMIVTAVGVQAAVIGTGIVLPVSPLLCGRALLHVDEHATVPVVEIALLQDVPRTATCVAVGPAQLYALERDPFIAAVTGYRRSRNLAGRLVDRRLATVPASTA
jgi:hypothetical protein